MESSKKNEGGKKKEAETKNPPIKKTADLIKLKLDKLMQNIDKPVVIPERPKQKHGPSVPEFVRNVMGSSAGAGSGEFHVYRHLRRKEYARQKFIQHKSELELQDDAYHKKLEDNAKAAKEATAKKRAKRLKRKLRKKVKKDSGESKNEDKDKEGDSGSDGTGADSDKDSAS